LRQIRENNGRHSGSTLRVAASGRAKACACSRWGFKERIHGVGATTLKKWSVIAEKGEEKVGSLMLVDLMVIDKLEFVREEN
jgi:hypothetical protein